ncbi:MAG: hypothetical protein ACP5H3_03215 [Candidatus Aenigmatarchaeota archaeon]
MKKENELVEELYSIINSPPVDNSRVFEIVRKLSEAKRQQDVKDAICRLFGVDPKKYKITSSISTMVTSLLFLKELSPDLNLKKVLNRLPQLLTYSIEKMQRNVDYLKELGLDTRKALNRLPALLTYSVERNLKPKVEYLTKEMRISISTIESTLFLLALSLEGRIKPRWEYLKSLGKDYIKEEQKVRCLWLKEEDFKAYVEKL